MQQKKKKDKQESRATHGQENLSREPESTTRRKALKTIAAGTAVAGTLAFTGKWSKPVVDTIILPAHAQATNAQEPTDATNTTTPTPTTTGNT